MKNYRNFLVAILIGICGVGTSMLLAQEAKNVVIADFVSTEELYQRQDPFPYDEENSIADIWGWTYSGNEYALVCLGSESENGSGLALVKVTDPNSVEYVKTIKRGNLTAEDNAPADVKVFNNYAFVGQNSQTFYYVNLVTALNNPGDPDAGVTDFNVGHRVHNLFINTNNGLMPN